MTQQTINIGNQPNDGTGDPVRTAFTKTNQNFTELYTSATNQNPAGTTGQIQYNLNGTNFGAFTMSGDVTVVPSTGVATVNAPGSHITYTQGGTGSVSRTVTNKLQESVSISDFGSAVGGYWDTALSTAIAYLSANGGGTLNFGVGTYAFANAFPTPASQADAVLTAYPIKLKGVSSWSAGAQNAGVTSALYGATVLDFQCSATYGKIALNNSMLLQLEDLVLTATANFSTPLLYVTNTVISAYNVCFYGQSGTQRTCAQDAIVLGGTNNVEGGSGWNDGFQGYGTGIRQCYFHRIRRCIQGRVFTNAITVESNQVWVTCGSSNTTDGAFMFSGYNSSIVDVGNNINNNLIELTGYYYGIYLTNSIANNLLGNSFYDAGTSNTFAAVYTDSNSTYNRISSSYVSQTGGAGQLALLDDAGRYKSTGVTGVPTYVSGTSFTMTGDQTATFYVGRRVRLQCTTKVIFGTITASSFSSSTTVTITVNFGPSSGIDNTVSAVTLEQYGLMTNIVDSATQAYPSQAQYLEVLDGNYPSKMQKLVLNYTAGSDSLLIQPSSAAGAIGSGVQLMRILKGAADGATVLLSVTYAGSLYFGDPGGSITPFFNGGRWGTNGAGQNLLWDSGTGGSYGILKHYALSFQRYDTGAYLTGLASLAGNTQGKEVWATNNYISGNLPRVFTPCTVATLPTPAAGLNGAKYHVSDASVVAAGNFGTVVAGGGANSVPVYCDGTNWRIG